MVGSLLPPSPCPLTKPFLRQFVVNVIKNNIIFLR
jgi:hypothetical protein